MKQILFLSIFFTQFLMAQSNWQPLFNQSDLSNFQQLNGTAEYKLENGELIGISKLNTPNSFLATKEKYGDFILEFEVLIENGLNSGVQFRSEIADKESGSYVFGYQSEIETTERKWAGGIYDESRRGWLYPLTRNEKGQNAFKNGTWNHYRIEAIGQNIRTWVNGIQCANLVDDWTAEGFIAFQVHAIWQKKNEGKIARWRNVQILTEGLEKERKVVEEYASEISYLNNQLTENEKRKGWRLLWDGKTTNGWRGAKMDEFPEKGWEIKEGVLTVLAAEGGESQNGGDIITKETFSNFELTVDFMISEGANSGIKYFVDPNLNKGEGSAIGLEFQILDDAEHPDAKNGVGGNRTLGSLYDLIPAENLSEPNRKEKRAAWKNQYNRARIIVKNGKVEHWLNEIKVVEYQRFSQLFKALVQKSKYKIYEGFGQQRRGHILLQDHGNLVSFKNVKIREF